MELPYLSTVLHKMVEKESRYNSGQRSVDSY